MVFTIWENEGEDWAHLTDIDSEEQLDTLMKEHLSEECLEALYDTPFFAAPTEGDTYPHLNDSPPGSERSTTAREWIDEQAKWCSGNFESMPSVPAAPIDPNDIQPGESTKDWFDRMMRGDTKQKLLKFAAILAKKGHILEAKIVLNLTQQRRR